MDTIHTIGRRKESVARVYLSDKKEKTGAILINKRDYAEYFNTPTLRYKITQPLSLTENLDKYDIKATVTGGGLTGQAEAIRLGISRALCKLDPTLPEVQDDEEEEGSGSGVPTNRKKLKKEGLLTRDPRSVLRKLYGRKKARKKSQFSKR